MNERRNDSERISLPARGHPRDILLSRHNEKCQFPALEECNYRRNGGGGGTNTAEEIGRERKRKREGD